MVRCLSLTVVILLVALPGLARDTKCADAYAGPSNPLSYRNRSLFTPGEAPKVYDESAFRSQSTEASTLALLLEAHRAKLPAGEQEDPFQITIPGLEVADSATRARLSANFRAISDVFNDLRGRNFVYSKSFARDLSNEAVAKAIRLLINEGITVIVHHDPLSAETHLELSAEGPHRLNQAAEGFASRDLPLRILYYPAGLLRNHHSAALYGSTDMHVSNEAILNKSSRDIRYLHELRHWLNHAAIKRGDQYALSGYSSAKPGRLPGHRDIYSSGMFHDEPHAYFETAKQKLIGMLSNLKLGAPVTGDELGRILEYGYRVSYRNEAIARIILGLKERAYVYQMADGHDVDATIYYRWGRNRIWTRIPLPLSVRAQGREAYPAFLDKQVEWMRSTSAETRWQFDRAYQALKRMNGTMTVEGLREIQSMLVPVDYRTAPAQ